LFGKLKEYLNWFWTHGIVGGIFQFIGLNILSNGKATIKIVKKLG